jgi:hypothetical protein
MRTYNVPHPYTHMRPVTGRHELSYLQKNSLIYPHTYSVVFLTYNMAGRIGANGK